MTAPVPMRGGSIAAGWEMFRESHPHTAIDPHPDSDEDDDNQDDDE